MATSAVALARLGRDGEGAHERDEQQSYTTAAANNASRPLPPVDRGWHAWTFLAAGFLLDGIVWGLPFSFGVFQAYYSSNEHFASQGTSIATIGTTCTSVSLILCPFFCIVMQRWPAARRPSMVIGLVIAPLSVIIASFCNTVSWLIVSQGLMYAFGCILLYFPAMLFLNEWFVARKGLAYGAMWAGSGTGGVVLPFLMKWLLDKYGYRTTLRVWAIVMVVTAGPCLFFVKARLPVSSANALRPRDLSFVGRRPFWLFQFGNVIYSLGVLIPSLWMPSFAASMDFPAYAGPLSVALYNAGFLIGAIVLGHVTDRCSVTVSITISTIGAMGSALIFWGLASTPAMLEVFALFWGFFAGGFNGSWTGCAAVMRRVERNGNVDTGIVIALMAAGKGLGGVVSGPLSESLLRVGWKTQAQFAYGTAFGPLVIFCGVSAAFGGTAAIGRLIRLI